MSKTKSNKLSKEQWEQLTHEEKRALAQKRLDADLAISRGITRQRVRDETVAARKWQEDAPKREAFAVYMSGQRRLKKG